MKGVVAPFQIKGRKTYTYMYMCVCEREKNKYSFDICGSEYLIYFMVNMIIKINDKQTNL